MFRNIRRRVIAIAGFLIIIASTASGKTTDISRKLDEKAAQALAASAYGEGVTPPEFISSPWELAPDFFVFQVLAPSPAEGSPGYFAVNPWTGDVWALWGCHKMTNPAVRKAQAQIRQRFTRKELKEYSKLRHLKPECIVETS